MQSCLIDPDRHGAACQRRAEPDLLAADPQVPDGGTWRSTSTPMRHGSAACVAMMRQASLVSSGDIRPCLAGTRSSSVDAAGENREAGKAMFRDWCGRSVL